MSAAARNVHQRIVEPGDDGEPQNEYVNAGETLRKAMILNPRLQVHVASGYYDLATPHYAAEYAFRHLGLDSSLRGNVQAGTSECGHMMYTGEASLVRLKEVLAAFVRDATGVKASAIPR